MSSFTVLGVGVYRAKMTHEKVDFLTKKIECTTPIPFDQAWSRAYKKVGVMHSIDQGPEKSESDEGAENGPFPHTNSGEKQSCDQHNKSIKDVRTLAVGAPPLVHVRGCRSYPRTPRARNSRSPGVQRTSASTPRSGVARRAA